MPVRHAVEVAHACPDTIITRVDDGRDVNPSHGVYDPFLRGPRSVGGSPAPAAVAGGEADLVSPPPLRDESLMPCMSRASRIKPGILARLPPSTPISERIESISGAWTRYRNAESITSSVALRPPLPPPLALRPST